MSDLLSVMALPLLACLVLTGIHAYLGFHVIERQVIFVDLALAQIAALGASIAIIFGFGFDSPQAYWFSLGFTVIGAAIFSLTRLRQERIPQEALIGIIYAVAAALLVMVLSREGEGDEHIRQALIGNILLVTPKDIWTMLLIYIAIGIFHIVFHKQFMAISKDPEKAAQDGLNVKLWDFLFYLTFGIVVTSSVKIAGVLLVFAFLIVPPVCAMLFAQNTKARLLLGWGIGILASIIGMLISYYGDYPTGASVVCVFGALLLTLLLAKFCYRKF